jgi:hypothetical protein
MDRLAEQRLDELDTLHAEAAAARNLLVQDALARVRAAVVMGLTPIRDDAMLVQQFIGARTSQNRYGQ